MQDFICTACHKLTDKWERFPGNVCPTCHAEANDRKPVEAPDFIKTISNHQEA